MSSEQLGDALNALWRRWKSGSPVKRGVITQEQYWVLKNLVENGPMRIKDLASMLGCTAGSASVTVKRMERDGLVVRERSKLDERVVTVRASGKGREKFSWWRKEQLGSVTDIFDTLASGERETLLKLLRKGLSSGRMSQG